VPPLGVMSRGATPLGAELPRFVSCDWESTQIIDVRVIYTRKAVQALGTDIDSNTKKSQLFTKGFDESNVYYRQQLNVVLRPISWDYSTGSELWDDSDCSLDYESQLNAFMQWIQQQNEEAALWIRIDHCYNSGANANSDVAGYAKKSSLCDQGSNAGLVYLTGRAQPPELTLGHEVGHIFGASHTSEGVMCADNHCSSMLTSGPGQGLTGFAPANEVAMCNEVRSQLACPFLHQEPPATSCPSLLPSGNTCVGNSANTVWDWLADHGFGLGDSYGTTRLNLDYNQIPHGTCIEFGCVKPWAYQGGGTKVTMQCNSGNFEVVDPQSFQIHDNFKCSR